MKGIGVRVTSLNGGHTHLLADKDDVATRCGRADWHSYVLATDWTEEEICALCVAHLARDLDAPIPDLYRQALEKMAGPWPVEWLLPPRQGDPRRVIELFAGPGGWTVGFTAVLGADLDAVGVDISPDACATAGAAGHRRIVADITALDPTHPALRWTSGVIVSPPCPPWAPCGKRAGHLAANLRVLSGVFAQLARLAASIRDHGEALRTGVPWSLLREPLAELTDARIGLMAEVVIWPMALQAAEAPLEWVAMEQSSALPAQVAEDLREVYQAAGWKQARFEVLDAADVGVASRRRRLFMLASRHTATPAPAITGQPAPTVSLAAALGWEPGERVNTRGARPIDPATGRAKGGNTFSADAPSWCLTGKARTWYRESDGLRLTEAEAGQLVGFPTAYPWQGARTSIFQQAGDAVSPPVAAVVLGALLGRDWDSPVRDYLRDLYSTDQAAPAAAGSAATAAVRPLPAAGELRLAA